MKRTTPPSSKKRRVTLTLSEDLVNEAKALKAIADTVAAWNTFNAKSGSIADEYSTL